MQLQLFQWSLACGDHHQCDVACRPLRCRHNDPWLSDHAEEHKHEETCRKETIAEAYVYGRKFKESLYVYFAPMGECNALNVR